VSENRHYHHQEVLIAPDRQIEAPTVIPNPTEKGFNLEVLSSGSFQSFDYTIESGAGL
jgi:hypothetical protein